MGINTNAQYNGFVYEPSKYKSSPLPAIGTSQNLNKPQSSSSAIITKPEIEEIDLFRYDDNPTEVFSKTNLDKNDFGIKTEVEADTSSFLDVLKSTGATVAVGATTILSGTWKLNEMLGDGAVWLLGTAASGVLDLFNQDEIADYIKQETKDFIARDMIGEANELFYEKTGIGRAINEASYLKYDSETARKIQKVSTVATELVAATALTVATGGAAAPVAAAMVIGTGFVAGVGESAEKRYQDPNNDGYDTGAILLDGIGNGFEWYATGKLGQSALSMFQAVGQSIAQTGVKGTVKFFKNMAIDKLKQFNIKNLFNVDFYKKSLKNGLLDFDQLIDSVSMGVDNITSAINSGEKLDWAQFTKEILGSYALNFAFDGFTNLFSKNLGNVDDFVQKVDEARTTVFNGFVKKNKVNNNSIDFDNPFLKSFDVEGKDDFFLNYSLEDILDKFEGEQEIKEFVFNVLTNSENDDMIKIMKKLIDINEDGYKVIFDFNDEYFNGGWDRDTKTLSIGEFYLADNQASKITVTHELAHLLLDYFGFEDATTDLSKIIYSFGNVSTVDVVSFTNEIYDSYKTKAKELFMSDLTKNGFTLDTYKQQIINLVSPYLDSSPVVVKYFLKEQLNLTDDVLDVIVNDINIDDVVDLYLEKDILFRQYQLFEIEQPQLTALEDMLDALSGGNLLSLGQVKYGHGVDYYDTAENIIHELVANYASLKLNNFDDAIVLLKDTFGNELVDELEKIYQKIIN